MTRMSRHNWNAGSLRASQFGQPSRSGCCPATKTLGPGVRVHNEPGFHKNSLVIGHDGESISACAGTQQPERTRLAARQGVDGGRSHGALHPPVRDEGATEARTCVMEIARLEATDRQGNSRVKTYPSLSRSWVGGSLLSRSLPLGQSRKKQNN